MRGLWGHGHRLTSKSTLNRLLELCVVKVHRLRSSHSNNGGLKYYHNLGNGEAEGYGRDDVLY